MTAMMQKQQFHIQKRQVLVCPSQFLASVSVRFLASLNGRSENIVIKSVIIFELAFRDVERQIFSTDFVVAADDDRLKIDQKPSIVFVWTAPMT